MVEVRVPATVANLGPGYDVLGLALKLYNTIELEKSDSLCIRIEGQGAGSLPKDESNIAYQAIQEVFRVIGCRPFAVQIRLTNNIPIARGLGSSGAARLGALVAANELAGGGLSKAEILKLASRLEGHPDNVTAALVGGLVISCLDGDEVRYLRVNPPRDIKVVLAIPGFEVATNKARGVLPREVPLEDAIANMGRTALLVAALSTGNFDILDFATQDRLHQPYRKSLVPCMEEVFWAARAAGAKGVVLSGSGPSICALADRRPKEIGQAMGAVFARCEIESQILILGVDLQGTRIIQRSKR
jgi:homoserine kinase